MSTNKACINRLQKEYKALLKEPVPHISAHPSPSSLLEWHYVLEGTPDSPYKGGIYHGKIVFPPQYPFKPPSLQLYTPTGRFAVNTKLCLSMSDFHPETWNPMWSVGTILNGLLSFLHDEQLTTGAIESSTAERQQLAAQSLAFNVKNPTFRKIFTEWVEEHERRVASPGTGSEAAADAEKGAAVGAAAGAAGDVGGAVGLASVAMSGLGVGAEAAPPATPPATSAPQQQGPGAASGQQAPLPGAC